VCRKHAITVMPPSSAHSEPAQIKVLVESSPQADSWIKDSSMLTQGRATADAWSMSVSAMLLLLAQQAEC
jgi:hypothetical protein